MAPALCIAGAGCVCSAAPGWVIPSFPSFSSLLQGHCNCRHGQPSIYLSNLQCVSVPSQCYACVCCLRCGSRSLVRGKDRIASLTMCPESTFCPKMPPFQAFFCCKVHVGVRVWGHTASADHPRPPNATNGQQSDAGSQGNKPRCIFQLLVGTSCILSVHKTKPVLREWKH